MIYLIVLILLLLLSFRYDINGKTRGREQCYLAMLVIFILIAGLRWRLGVDTPNYLNSFYHRYPTLDHFSFENYPIGKDPFYVLINSVVKSFFGGFYVVQLIQATFVNVLIFKYINKHSKYIFTCILLYYLIGYIGYTMEIMRGSMSIVLCLFANDYILDKKWIKGYLLYALALCFHAQTVVLFVLPVLFFLRLNKFGVLLLGLAFIVGYLIQAAFGDYLMLLDLDDAIVDKAEKYAESDKYGGQGGNINFFIVYILPNMIYGVLALIYMKRNHIESKLLKLEPMLMLGMMFLMIQMSMQIAYRFVDYYRIYFIMFCAESFVYVAKNVKLSSSLAYCRAWILIFPFVFLLVYPRLAGKMIRYVPYISVFEREVVKERELKYHNGNTPRPIARDNEY